MTTVSAAFALTRGRVELGGLFGLWSIFIGWRLYRMRPGIRAKAINIYVVIKALDFLCVVLGPVLVVSVLVFGFALGLLHDGTPAGLSEALWSIAGFTVLTADLFFAGWALKKLRSSEFEELLGYGALERSRISRFSVASAFLWTTVIACALSTYQYDIQHRPISSGSSFRGSLHSAGGINVFYAKVRKRSTFGNMEIFIAQVMVDPEKEHSPDEYSQPFAIRDGAIYLNGKRYAMPPNQNVVFFNPDGSEESDYLPLERMQLSSYLQECGNSEVVPSLAGLKEFLGMRQK